MTTTLIKAAELAVAWDSSAKAHSYAPDTDIAFTDGTLTFVGRGYEGAADAVIDGRPLMRATEVSSFSPSMTSATCDR